MADVRVPKSMGEEAAVWAFRHGIIGGMRARGRLLPKAGHAYVAAPRNVLRLADRVRIEWMRRHPALTTKEN